MRFQWALTAGALLGARLVCPGAPAGETNALQIIEQLQRRIDKLEKQVKALQQAQAAAGATNEPAANPRVQELEQKVKTLERDRERETEAAEARKEAPTLTLGEQGISFASANGNFGVQLRGVLQVDSRTYFGDAGTVGNDGLLLRRARPILQGTVFRDFDFVFIPDFGVATSQSSTPVIQDAYLNYRYSPALQFQAGKYKVPVGLELLQPDPYGLFNERALPTDLVPVRDVGFMLHGDLFGGIASYAAGIFNGVADTASSSNADFEDDKAFAGRVFFLPFKQSSAPALAGFGFGVGGSYESVQQTTSAVSALPSGYLTAGLQKFFAYNPTNGAVVYPAGDHWRLAPQAYYYYGPFNLLGEYNISNQRVTRTGGGSQPVARLDHTAWQIAAGWVLTGEDAAYGASVAPRYPFNPAKGHWGALQLVGRFSELDIDPAAFPTFSDPASSARSAKECSAGLNWFLNQNIRVNASFSHTWFDGGGHSSSASAPASVTQEEENVFFTRVQLAF